MFSTHVTKNVVVSLAFFNALISSYKLVVSTYAICIHISIIFHIYCKINTIFTFDQTFIN